MHDLESSGTKQRKAVSDVIWISHRGYTGDGATENTKAAFDAAIRLGFQHLETDLRLTRNGVIVIHHDDELKRTFGQAGKISNSDWPALKALGQRGADSLLTLDELYGLYPETFWTFDIKTPGDEKTLTELSLWAKRRGAESWLHERVRFLLWTTKADRHAECILPQIMRLAREPACYRAGFFSLIGLPGLGRIQQGLTYSVPPTFAGCELFTARILASYHQRGARLLAYLPPTDDLAKRAYELGFDEILTNGLKAF